VTQIDFLAQLYASIYHVSATDQIAIRGHTKKKSTRFKKEKKFPRIIINLFQEAASQKAAIFMPVAVRISKLTHFRKTLIDQNLLFFSKNAHMYYDKIYTQLNLEETVLQKIQVMRNVGREVTIACLS
jgi:hypothetical protein